MLQSKSILMQINHKRPDVVLEQWVFADLMTPLEGGTANVFENERYLTLLGWSAKYLLMGEPPLADENGTVVASKESVRPPIGCAWAGQWQIVFTDADKQGWGYTSALGRVASRSKEASPTTSIRIRSWSRKYSPTVSFFGDVATSPTRMAQLPSMDIGLAQCSNMVACETSYVAPRRCSKDSDLAVVYESERYYVLGGWSGVLLPLDPSHWSPHTRADYPVLDSFEWVGDWTIDRKAGDVDGFEYAFDFWSAFSPASWAMATVRRRRWIRTMQPLME